MPDMSRRECSMATSTLAREPLQSQTEMSDVSDFINRLCLAFGTAYTRSPLSPEYVARKHAGLEDPECPEMILSAVIPEASALRLPARKPSDGCVPQADLDDARRRSSPSCHGHCPAKLGADCTKHSRSIFSRTLSSQERSILESLCRAPNDQVFREEVAVSFARVLGSRGIQLANSDRMCCVEALGVLRDALFSKGLPAPHGPAALSLLDQHASVRSRQPFCDDSYAFLGRRQISLLEFSIVLEEVINRGRLFGC